jgi:hypothetical protein
MIQSTPAERYPKVSYMRPEGTMEYYTDQTRGLKVRISHWEKTILLFTLYLYVQYRYRTRSSNLLKAVLRIRDILY